MQIKLKISFIFILIVYGCQTDKAMVEYSDVDCAGIVNGNSIEDKCGVCDDDPTNNCEPDCADIWGGSNICGCTDSIAINYNSNATFDDGSCDTSLAIISFVKDLLPQNSCASSIDIKQTNDGGYIIAGCKDDKAWLMKTDFYGNKEWDNTYNLGDYWGNRTVIQTSDGGYLYAGWEGVIKTDSDGNQVWKKAGTPGSGQNPYYEDVIEHSNGNFYLVGGPVVDRNNYSKGGQALLVKMSSSGGVLKTKFYGGDCEDDLFRSVIESNDGKLIMVGEKGHGNQSYPCSFDFKYYKDIYVVKTNLNGGIVFQKTYGGNFLEKGMDIVRKVNESGYIVLGQQCKHRHDVHACGPITKVMMLDIDENGNSLDQSFLGGLKFYEFGTPMALANTSFGGYVFVTSPKNGGDMWLYKWGAFEENLNMKISPGGFGGESIERTSDNGFIISTSGGTVIKTDSQLEY